MNAEKRFCYANGGCGLALLQASDKEAYLEAARASAQVHAAWMEIKTGEADFEELLARNCEANFRALAIHHADGQFLGMIHVSQIIRGAFQNAFLSYWIDARHTGQGWMTVAMRLALHDCFGELGLHRVEANIQPDNLRSIALVRRIGMVKEGFSEKYLRIRGEWRDHERWAVHVENWAERDWEIGERPEWR